MAQHKDHFSIYVNNLPSIFNNSFVQLYTDDTVIYTSKPDLPQIQASLQSDFNILQHWFSHNKLLLNKTKSNIMIFGTREKLKSNPISCVLTCNDGTPLHKVDKIKYLGVWLYFELSLKLDVDHVLHEVNLGINVLHRSQNCFTRGVCKKLASQLILMILDYCDVVNCDGKIPFHYGLMNFELFCWIWFLICMYEHLTSALYDCNRVTNQPKLR